MRALVTDLYVRPFSPFRGRNIGKGEALMDPKLLPEDLHPDRMKTFAASEYPVTQINPITGYRTSLNRSGTGFPRLDPVDER